MQFNSSFNPARGNALLHGSVKDRSNTSSKAEVRERAIFKNTVEPSVGLRGPL